MIDARKIEVRSIEELIAALRPIRSEALDDESTLPRLRLMRSNISAVLSFTIFSSGEAVANNPEYRQDIEDVRRQCLMINGIVSRIMFRQRWLFAKSTIEDVSEVLDRYEQIAAAACRICSITTPKLRDVLLCSF
ncbi:MAG TPA: hypothetical protein VM578_03435 [Candidatus Saccharimonadales bacterium]|nr:hypothetical protein [Candidatus Saccharimonadales bacterium]